MKQPLKALEIREKLKQASSLIFDAVESKLSQDDPLRHQCYRARIAIQDASNLVAKDAEREAWKP